MPQIGSVIRLSRSSCHWTQIGFASVELARVLPAAKKKMVREDCKAQRFFRATCLI